MVQEIINKSVTGGGGIATVDLDCQGHDQLTVVAQLMATVTVGDLTAFAARTYRADGAALILSDLPTVRAVAAASDGANVVAQGVYDIRGMKKVQVRATNANVGAKTLVVTAYLG